MTAVEVKGRDPKITWEIVGIDRAPNEDTCLLESGSVFLIVSCNIPCWFVVQSWEDSMLAVYFGIRRC